jgi:hypothetical protein
MYAHWGGVKFHTTKRFARYWEFWDAQGRSVQSNASDEDT